jgi:hypothetical protein
MGFIALAATTSCATDTEHRAALGRWGETRLTRDLVIGRAEGPGEYLFGRIGAIVQQPDGTVLIADTQVPVIRRYDAAGSYMHDIGRAGEGPGEYRRVGGVGLLPSNDIAVWDSRARRVSIFRVGGEFVRDFSVEGTSAFAIDDLGNVFLRKTVVDNEDPDGHPRRTYLKYTSTGDLIETIPLPSDKPDSTQFVFTTRQGSLPNFTKQTLTALDARGYLVVGYTSRYEIEVRRGDGVVLRFEHAWEPVRIKAEEKELWENRLAGAANWARERGEPVDFAAVPAFKPAFFDLVVGGDATIWVRRYGEAFHRERPDHPPESRNPPFTWWEYPAWDVFDEQGSFLGSIELPYDTSIREFHGDYVWCVQPDKNEEDIAVRFRIEKGGGK